MLTWLAIRGVPKEEPMALVGHAAQDITGRNCERLTPEYLQGAIREIDAFFTELTKHTRSQLRSGRAGASFREIVQTAEDRAWGWWS
jgi:hypothetical protein